MFWTRGLGHFSSVHLRSVEGLTRLPNTSDTLRRHHFWCPPDITVTPDDVQETKGKGCPSSGRWDSTRVILSTKSSPSHGTRGETMGELRDLWLYWSDEETMWSRERETSKSFSKSTIKWMNQEKIFLFTHRPERLMGRTTIVRKTDPSKNKTFSR